MEREQRMCVCSVEQIEEPLYGDDCPFCGASALYTIATCYGRVSGPYCREHAEQIRSAIHGEIHVLTT